MLGLGFVWEIYLASMTGRENYLYKASHLARYQSEGLIEIKKKVITFVIVYSTS